MNIAQRKHAAILGALTADAASLGYHWLYDPDRLAEVAGEAPEFADPNPADYEGGVGYFAHGHKRAGELTHYGEQLAVALRSLAQSDGAWDPHHYLAEFRATFERGGSFHGYIDGATSGTLDNAKKAEADAKDAAKKAGKDVSHIALSAVQGADDNQMPAFSKLPPIVARYAGDPRLTQIVEEAVRVTNNNNEAAEYAIFGALTLEKVILGASILDALQTTAAESPDKVRDRVQSALNLKETRPKEIGRHFGQACYAKDAMPVSVAILRDRSTFVEGVRANIFAAGDNAGRGIFVGAMLGAAGATDDSGIPISWLARLRDLGDYLRLSERVCTSERS